MTKRAMSPQEIIEDEIDISIPVDDLSWMDDDSPAQTAKKLPSPLVHARRVARREFIAGLKKEALNTLIPVLPPPDTDLHIVSNGSGAETGRGLNPLAFDFGSFIPYLVEMIGPPCIAYISTWTAARQHTRNMVAMVEDGRLAALTFCTDPYFQTREAAMYAEFIITTQKFGKRVRFLSWKNHVKCIAIASADETRTCVITGSANLSAQPRCEQYVLTTAPDVYQFYRDQFFEAMFSKND